MLALTQLKDGDTFHWAIEDILRHNSVDLNWYGEGAGKCPECGTLYIPEIDYYGPECGCRNESSEFEDLSTAELWDFVLEHKRNDHWYDDLKHVITTEGFDPSKPFTARPQLHGELIFGDGHHRLAIAIDMGLECIPVTVKISGWCADDSGSWGDGDE